MLHDLIQTVQYHEELNFKTFFKIISFKPNTGNLGMFSPSEYKKKPQNQTQTFEKMQETNQRKFQTKLSL